MKQILIFLSLAVFCLTNFGYSQMIMTKDGVPLGDREEFITSCVASANDKLMEVNGLKIETKSYCTCISDNLIPTLTSTDIIQALNEGKMLELFLEDENFEIILGCVEDILEVEDDYVFGSSEYNDLQIEVGIKSCVKEIMEDEESIGIWTEDLAYEYCECAINKLYEVGYTYQDLMKIEDEDSEVFNEITIPCINDILDFFEDSSVNYYDTDDIIGDKIISRVELVDYLGQGYKVKMSIGGITKYFLFDTGASDLMIDRSFELELIENGTLKEENYLEVVEYYLANNEVVDAQLVLVDNIKIGDYTVNNVVIAILENASPLCGKGFLDKFMNWEVDISTKTLILYR